MASEPEERVKVVPSKAQDWLFEDIVHLDTIRRGEYDHYVKLLMYFLDPDRIRDGWTRSTTPPRNAPSTSRDVPASTGRTGSWNSRSC